MTKKYATVLIVAGSDSVGGAGIQADLKTCMTHGVYAMTAITAVTAQNTCGVRSFQAVGPEMLEAQITAVVDDVMPDAVKVGMLPDVDSINVVARMIEDRKLPNVVIDPVMVATSGDPLTSANTVGAMIGTLFPFATVLTPNIPETEQLTGISINSPETMVDAAEQLLDASGAGAILLKGGHSIVDADGMIGDLFMDCTDMYEILRHPLIDSRNTHGTGCTLSSAIACGLALGLDPITSCRSAVSWLSGAIASGAEWQLGAGHGPVDHLWQLGKYHQKP